MPNNDAMKNYDNLFYDDKLDIKSNVIDFAHTLDFECI